MDAKIVLRAGPTLEPISKRMAELQFIPANPVLSVGWTAEVDGEQAGLIVLQSIPLIYPLIMEPKFRGQGIGTQLVQAAADYVKNKTTAPRVLAYTNHPSIAEMITHPSVGMSVHPEQLFEWVRGK